MPVKLQKLMGRRTGHQANNLCIANLQIAMMVIDEHTAPMLLPVLIMTPVIRLITGFMFVAFGNSRNISLCRAVNTAISFKKLSASQMEGKNDRKPDKKYSRLSLCL